MCSCRSSYLAGSGWGSCAPPSVVPGGTETAARLHVARTICRRAEREVLLGAQDVELNPLVLAYLNRLSDLLFILARAANDAAGRDEPLWKPGSSP